MEQQRKAGKMGRLSRTPKRQPLKPPGMDDEAQVDAENDTGQEVVWDNESPLHLRCSQLACRANGVTVRPEDIVKHFSARSSASYTPPLISIWMNSDVVGERRRPKRVRSSKTDRTKSRSLIEEDLRTLAKVLEETTTPVRTDVTGGSKSGRLQRTEDISSRTKLVFQAPQMPALSGAALPVGKPERSPDETATRLSSLFEENSDDDDLLMGATQIAEEVCPLDDKTTKVARTDKNTSRSRFDPGREAICRSDGASLDVRIALTAGMARVNGTDANMTVCDSNKHPSFGLTDGTAITTAGADSMVPPALGSSAHGQVGAFAEELLAAWGGDVSDEALCCVLKDDWDVAGGESSMSLGSPLFDQTTYAVSVADWDNTADEVANSDSQLHRKLAPCLRYISSSKPLPDEPSSSTSKFTKIDFASDSSLVDSVVVASGPSLSGFNSALNSGLSNSQPSESKAKCPLARHRSSPVVSEHGRVCTREEIAAKRKAALGRRKLRARTDVP